MKKQNLISILIPVGVAVLFIFILFVFPDFSRLLELKAYDLKMRMTATLHGKDKLIAQQIKIIHVTDSTIREMGWPKQEDHARIIDILSQHQASLIAYDWIFYEPGQELLTATKNSKRLIWPVLFDLKPKTGFPKEKYPLDIFSQLEKYGISRTPSASKLWHTGNATLSRPALLQTSQALGHISSRNEEGSPHNDGIFRKVALVVDFAGQLFPSLSLVTACHYLHVPLEKLRIVLGEEIVLPGVVFPRTGIIKDIHIPINERGEMWVYFPGQWEDNAFEPFWFESMLTKHTDKSWWPKFDEGFSRNICFVGNASSKSKDTHTTPIENNYPGVGIHASALFTILSGNFIGFTGLPGNILIILALAISVGYISIRYPSLHSSVIHLLLLAGYVFLTFLIFAKQRFVIPTMFPAFTIFLGGIANLSYQFWSEQQEKESLMNEYQTKKTMLSQTMNEVRTLREELQNTRQITREKLRKLSNLEDKHKSARHRVEELERLLDKSPSIPHEEDQSKNGREVLAQEAKEVGIVTRSQAMLEIFRIVKRVANQEVTVLILGETGTGKGNLAHAIKELSSRKDKPFVTVDCGRLTETLLESELFGFEKGAFANAYKQKRGKFELAHMGTIFLDEIHSASPKMQQDLLRVIQEHKFERVGGEKTISVNVRVIAATNENLESMVRAGTFREDLYYRLETMRIDIPLLKERREDIEPLADLFIKKYVKKYQNSQIKGLSQKALEKLQNYDWPGNIRELENKINRAILLTNKTLISEQDIVFGSTNGHASDKPAADHPVSPAKEVRKDENRLPDADGDEGFLLLLNQNNFKMGKTAEELGKDRNTVGDRFKGLCLKAMAESDWGLSRAAESITMDGGNQKRAEAKLKEYYDNTLERLRRYDSLKDLQKEIGDKNKNMPKRFHPYIVKMYEERVLKGDVGDDGRS